LDFRIRQLQCFLTLSELLNYNQTARALYMSQPTITFQINSLEEAFGVKLFTRNRRQVRLTEAGLAFREYAQSIMDTVHAAQTRLSGMHTRQKLRVSCGPVGQFVLLPAILRTLAARHPDFKLEVIELSTEEQLARLPDGAVDALLMVGALPIPDARFDPLCEDSLIAMVSSRDPLARRAAISVEVLRDTPIIATRLKDCRFHQPFLHALLAPFGITPRIIESPQSCTTQFAYAASGEGLAIATRSMQACFFPGITAVPFQEKLPTLQLGLTAMHSNDSPALHLFRQVVADCAAAELSGNPTQVRHPKPMHRPVVTFPAHTQAS
jgi:DNA-binding transcriptional LysR family regulator